MRGMKEICDNIRVRFDEMDRARERSLGHSRQIIRHSGDAIKAIHRGEWEKADELIEETGRMVREVAAELTAALGGVAPEPKAS